MSGGIGDGGLLSMADVTDEGAGGFPNDLASSTNPSGWVDSPYIPLFSTGCLAPVRVYARNLVHLLVSESQKKTTNMEDLFLQKSMRSRHSLAASERIRGRLNTIIEFFISSISSERKANKLLTTAFLLSTSFNLNPKEGILEGLKEVDWEIATATSSLEIFRAITSFSSVLEEPDETFSASLFDLAVRSEHLSALVFCMDLPHCSHRRTANYTPPPTKQYSGTAQFSSDSFLPRCCEFPMPSDGRRCTVRCLPCTGGTVTVVSGSKLIYFNQLGMLGTRLVRLEERTVLLCPDERIVHQRESSILIVHGLGRSGACWKFHFREKSLLPNNAGKDRLSLLSINTAAIGNSSLTFCFSACQETMYCLICVNASSMLQRLCYVLTCPLNSLMSGQAEVTVSSSHLLKRQAAQTSGSPKALFLTPSSTVSLGRVSLKERFHPFCLELWVYPRSIKETQVVLSIGDKTVDEVLIEVEPSSDGLVWRGGARTPQLGASFASITVPGRLTACERWWFVVLNYTGVAWELSVDQTFFSRHTALVSSEGIRDAKCVLGKSFTGFLAEVRIWSHTRTATESMRDARRTLDGASEDGLLGYFPINEQGGHVVVDYSRHAQHTFLSHGAHFWSPVKQLPVGPPMHVPTIADFLPLVQASDA
ncbi:hypothetical protein STCU_08934, partial [Strigomonas culicis]